MPRITQHTEALITERKRIVNADIFISEAAVSDMISHADKGASENAEVMGLLAGHVHRDDKGIYAIAERTVTSRLLSDAVSVRFDHSDMRALFDALDGLNFDYVIVGWYHSHLGIGCFMSETDVATHESSFGDDTGFAVVIDPIREELKVFKNSKDGLKEASVIIMDDDQTQMA